MFDVALLLANQPVPAGNRVVIVTNALDPGVLAAAACAGSGLSVAPLSAPALDRLLAAGIPPVLAQGVVDLRPTASPGDYLAALGAVLVYPPGIAQKAAHELVSAAEGGWMEPGDAAALLGHYGIPVADAEPRGNHGAAEDRSP